VNVVTYKNKRIFWHYPTLLGSSPGETLQSTEKNKNTVIYELRIRMLVFFLNNCFVEYIWKTIQNRVAFFLLFGKQPRWFQ
jgi:hypothetical protein